MNRLTLAFILCIGQLAGEADATPTPTPTPTPQNLQNIRGDCNVVINNPQGGNVELPRDVICSGLAAPESTAASLQKMARFIEASNPTELKIADVSLIQWAGDQERYLTLTLKNTSNLPAEKVKLIALDVVRANEKQSSILPLSKSKAIPQKAMDTLAVSRHSTTQIPIGPESEIIILTKRRVSVGYDFIGASLSPNIPDKLKAEYINDKGIKPPYMLEIESAPIGVQLQYSTIFGGSNTATTAIYLFYGRADTR